MALQRELGAGRGLAMALDHAGLVASARGEFEAAHVFHTEAVAVDRTVGNRGYEAISLEAWSAGTYLEGDFALARTLPEASLALVSARDHHNGSREVDTNVTTYILGRIALCDGDAVSARQRFEANLRSGAQPATRAGPPDDVGGVNQYPIFLDALADPSHPEHQMYREWIGEDFDSEAFDTADVNQLLREFPVELAVLQSVD